MIRYVLAALCIPYACDGSKRGDDSNERSRGGASIVVEEAFARVLPSGVGALYAHILNDSDADDRLIDASSRDAKDAQLHDVMRAAGPITTRESIEGIVVPAHGALSLARGGEHIILFWPNAVNGRLSFTLRFERAGAVQVDAAVRSLLQP